MSSLVWECIRNNHAFLKKGHGPKVLSAEPGNMTHIHSFKFSGLAGRKTAGLTVVNKGKKEQITLVTKVATGKRACPKKLIQESGISKSSKKGAEFIAKALAFYRPDLVSAATAKFRKAKQSLRM